MSSCPGRDDPARYFWESVGSARCGGGRLFCVSRSIESWLEQCGVVVGRTRVLCFQWRCFWAANARLEELPGGAAAVCDNLQLSARPGDCAPSAVASGFMLLCGTIAVRV